MYRVRVSCDDLSCKDDIVESSTFLNMFCKHVLRQLLLLLPSAALHVASNAETMSPFCVYRHQWSVSA